MKFPCGCKVDAVRVISHPTKEAVPMVYPCKEHEKWFAEKAGDGTFLQGKENKTDEVIQLKVKLLDELLASQNPGEMLRILRRAETERFKSAKECPNCGELAYEPRVNGRGECIDCGYTFEGFPDG